MENKFIVEGFVFETTEVFEAAKKEAEAIAYIRMKTDITDASNALKIYSKMVEKQTFTTPVGIGFLKGLYDLIIKSGKVSAEDLRPITVKTQKKIQEKPVEAPKLAKEGEERLKNQVIDLQLKLKNNRIIMCFLVVIIVAMFGITLFHDNSPLRDAEAKIQSKYAAWEAELAEREEAVSQREETLNNSVMP